MSFVDDGNYFIGVNLGVRRSQVGVTTLTGEIEDEYDFETPADASLAVNEARKQIEKFIRTKPAGKLKAIGVSVPGMTDNQRQRLLFRRI